jgi:hypothetical protein
MRRIFFFFVLADDAALVSHVFPYIMRYAHGGALNAEALYLDTIEGLSMGSRGKGARRVRLNACADELVCTILLHAVHVYFALGQAHFEIILLPERSNCKSEGHQGGLNVMQK